MLDDDFAQAKSFLAHAPENEINHPLLESIHSKVLSMERRKLNREENRSLANLKIVGEDGSLNDNILPQIVNISEEGACMSLGNQSLLSSQKVTFEIELINNIPVEIPCQVMWNKLGTGKVFSGLKFFGLKEDALLGLRKFLKKREAERRRITFQVCKVETLYDREAKNLRGEITNISKNGMGIVLNKRLDVNSNIRVFLDLN